jgi:lipocalin
MINTSTVKELDLNRYLGTWYEIARYPNSFEKNLIGVTATYSLKADGKIKVLNQGYLKTMDGKHKVALGKAKRPNINEPGKFKVSFFLFFYADYYVLELDSVHYNWALIGSSSPKYVWILCRDPFMPADTYNTIVNKMKERGYDTKKLIKVPHK